MMNKSKRQRAVGKWNAFRLAFCNGVAVGKDLYHALRGINKTPGVTKAKIEATRKLDIEL